MTNQKLDLLNESLLNKRDYVSPGLSIILPDEYFPNMIVGDTNNCAWPYLRREIPHNWYVDQRQPTVGFVSRDEAHILYNTALNFKGKKALEVGCWLGWSACHLALAGVDLDVIDPLLARPEFYESVSNSLKAAGVLDAVNLLAGYSPQKVEELASQCQRKWSLIFIDGNHEAPGPLNDAIACEQLAEADALILFHDLASPDVAQGLDYLKQKGWHTMVYQTMQIMGVAWRGNVEPLQHQPDPNIPWSLPPHLQNYLVSGMADNQYVNIEPFLTQSFLNIEHLNNHHSQQPQSAPETSALGESDLNFRQINLIVFPNWGQPEESLYVQLSVAIKTILTHPDKSKIALLLDTSNVVEEDANTVLSAVVMNLIMEEDLDVADAPEISLLGKLSPMQWSALLSRIHYRIVLENENKQAVVQAGADNLPAVEQLPQHI